MSAWRCRNTKSHQELDAVRVVKLVVPCLAQVHRALSEAVWRAGSANEGVGAEGCQLHAAVLAATLTCEGTP